MEELLETNRTIQGLSDDLLQGVFANLSREDQQNCRSVCHRWHNIIDSTAGELRLGEADVEVLLNKSPPWYERWPAVKKLTVRAPTAATGSAGLEAFLDSLYNATWKLEELKIMNVVLSIKASEILARPGAPWRTLQALYFQMLLAFGPPQLEKLATGTWSQLESLNLLGNEKLCAADNGKALVKFLSRCPRLKSLDLTCSLRNTHLKEILRVKLPLLEHFNGSMSNLDVEAARALVKNASSWPSLKTLVLSYTKFGNNGLMELTKAEFPHLEELCISYNDSVFDQLEGYDVESILSLRNAIETRWRGLKRLDIVGVSPEAQAAFLQGDCPMLQKLRFEKLYTCHPMIVHELASAAQRGRLKLLDTLEIAGENVRAAVKDLFVTASWPNLENLKVSIYAQNVADVTAAALSKAVEKKHLPAVKSLHVRCIGPYVSSSFAARTMFQHPWPNLETLYLPLTDDSTPEFVHYATNLPNLVSLDVELNTLAVESMKMIFDAPWPALKKMSWGLRNFATPVPAEILEHIKGKWVCVKQRNGSTVFFPISK